MSRNRRDFFSRVATWSAGLLAGSQAAAQHEHHAAHKPAGRNIPVETPDLTKLPFRIVDGVKEFHLTAEPVRRHFAPGKTVDVWGYNGSMPGRTIEANQGDRIRIVFENRLPEPTAVHWHGLEVPVYVDGVPGLGMDPVKPGGRHVYEFPVLHQHGTFFYHSHMPMQELMGQIGLFIIYPSTAYSPPVDRDFGLILQEWSLLPNNTVPNTMAMDFNWLTLNGKAGPDCTPMLVKLGERVRIRMVNLGMDHHPMHLHGNTFYVTATEAGRIPEPWRPENTVLVGVAQARDIEFEAKYAGDWMLHCHLPHHMMNDMMNPAGPVSPLVANDHHLHGGAPNAKMVPGYPQDMWMTMDEAVEKPENFGLRAGWTGAMMGMMTLVRVLKPEVYDKIQELIKTTPRKRGPVPEHKHDHN